MQRGLNQYATRTSRVVDTVRATKETASRAKSSIHFNASLNRDIFDQLGAQKRKEIDGDTLENALMSPVPKSELKSSKVKLVSRQRRR